MSAGGDLKLLVVVAHPSPDSLNAALAAVAVKTAAELAAEVAVHDLYADGFDPRLRAEELTAPVFGDELSARYAADLLAADALVVVHPLWFFQAPAILKGWVDRVIREDVAFALGSDGAVSGLLTLRRALIVTTGNTSRATELGPLGDPVTRFWRDVVLRPAGVEEVERLAFTPVRDSSSATRDEWLATVRVAVGRLLAGA